MPLRVVHAKGETVYKSDVFKVDDASAVLIIYNDPSCNRVLAAFNREFWVTAELVEDGDPDGNAV